MATLKNSDREYLARRVLSDSFAPRFAAIRARIQTYVRTRLVAEHPRFTELLGDESAAKYLAIGSVTAPGFTVEGRTRLFVEPAVYGRVQDAPDRRYVDRCDYSRLQPGDAVIPACAAELGEVEGGALVADYLVVWSEYREAAQKLHALLQSYNVREKFAADFPELAAYLPPVTVKARLPVVVVDTVRAELSALGIPAGA